MKKIIYSALIICCLVSAASAFTVSKEVKDEWAKIGVKEGYIIWWQRAGIGTEEAARWINIMHVGYTGLKAINWKNAGVKTPEQALNWKNAGVSYSNVPMWKKLGLSIEEITQWMSIGVRKPSLVKKMKQAEMSTDEVKRWKEVLSDDYDYIIKMKKAGLTPEEVKDWEKAGVNIQYIAYWKKQGLVPKDILTWKKAGIAIQEIAAFKKDGLSPDEVLEWNQVGVLPGMIRGLKLENITPQDVKNWAKAGVTYGDISYYIKRKSISVEEAILWKTKGFFIDDAIVWKKAGYTVTDAVKWTELNVDIFRVKRLKKIGIKEPKEFNEWKKAGISTIKDIGFLKANNVSPDEITEKDIESNHKIISFLASSFDKSAWKDIYEKIKDKCQDNKCVLASFVNTAKVRNDMLLVKIDGSLELLNFPAEGFFSSSEVPETFTLINNKDKRFRSILKPAGVNKIELNGEEYKIKTYEVVIVPPSKR